MEKSEHSRIHAHLKNQIRLAEEHLAAIEESSNLVLEMLGRISDHEQLGIGCHRPECCPECYGRVERG